MLQREKTVVEEDEEAAVNYEWLQFEKAMQQRNTRAFSPGRRVYSGVAPRPGLLFLTVPFLLLVLILLCLGLAAGRTRRHGSNNQTEETESLPEDYSVDYNDTTFLVNNNGSSSGEVEDHQEVPVSPPLQGSIIEVPVCPGGMKRIHGKCRKIIKVFNSGH